MKTILDALQAPELFGDLFPPTEWRAWWAFLGAVFALPLGPKLRAVYTEHTGRTAVPTERVDEAYMIVGRSGGKSRVAALLAVYLACFHDWRPQLAPGQLALIAVIAADRDQARIVFRYILGLLDAVPTLKAFINGKPRSAGVDLHTGVTIEVRTASFRTVRGYALVAAVLDEIAYWMTDDASLNPDREIVNALRPGLARVRGSLLIGLSSPYARRGVLFEAWEKHYGKEGDPVLVWRAPTRAMNPTFPQIEIDKALADDAPKASAEYLVEFRSDLQGYVDPDVVAAVTITGRYELAPVPGRSYSAFADPSGGSVDSFTLAIGSVEEGKGVLACLREREAPFNPTDVVAEFSAVLKTYGCTIVRGDKYAGEWPKQAFAAHGITYQVISETKSELYVALLPALNSARLELLEVPRLTKQLCQLERRTSAQGKDTVDHPPGGHDDCANVIAGLFAPLLGNLGDTLGFYRFWGGRAERAAAAEAAAVPRAGQPIHREGPPAPPGMTIRETPDPSSGEALERRRKGLDRLVMGGRGR